MIQVANPRAGEGEGEDRQPDTIYVFRPWTVDDIKKATEDIPHPKTKAAAFIEGINGLYHTYRLNGNEMERAMRQILGPD